MSINNKKTSLSVGRLASEVLRDTNASQIQKALAASALAQRNGAKQTGAQMEDRASRVLHSEKYSDKTKTLAGAVLSQSNKER